MRTCTGSVTSAALRASSLRLPSSSGKAFPGGRREDWPGGKRDSDWQTAVHWRITLMRTPVVKRQTLPMSGFLAFFRSFNLGVVRLWQRLLTSFPSEEQTARVCTKHLLRLCHHSHGDSRELSSAFSAA